MEHENAPSKHRTKVDELGRRWRQQAKPVSELMEKPSWRREPRLCSSSVGLRWREMGGEAGGAGGVSQVETCNLLIFKKDKLRIDGKLRTSPHFSQILLPPFDIVVRQIYSQAVCSTRTTASPHFSQILLPSFFIVVRQIYSQTVYSTRTSVRARNNRNKIVYFRELPLSVPLFACCNHALKFIIRSFTYRHLCKQLNDKAGNTRPYLVTVLF